MLLRARPLMSTLPPRAFRLATAPLLLAVLAACQTTPTAPSGPGNVSRLPPGNAQRDGPEAKPPPNLEAVPDAVPQIEAIRTGGPNKPYEIAGHTYVPMTDDRALSEKGLASWYGKKFHGRRTASGESYNMYAMTAAHKTLPIPSYARVRNPANGKEVIVRVNDRGPFSPGRIIDLSYTAALKLGVLNGVAPVEITRITDDDIRTGAALRKPPTLAGDAPATLLRTDKPDERTRADTTAGIGWWIQLGAFKQRDGALDFQRRLIDEQPWLGPLLAVFNDHGLNKLQAGPYTSRDDARSAAERIRTALQLVPTIVEKR